MIKLQADYNRYFKQQYDTTVEFIIPFINEVKPITKGMRFMEVGSGFGGICKAFADAGCQVTGIELLTYISEHAKEFVKEDIQAGKLEIINQNVYDIEIGKHVKDRYDIIVLKDTIEHIHDQERFIKHIHRFLKEDGVIFFAFPPWYMPLGGHQQGLDSKYLHLLPYFHLLPNFMYRGIMKLFGEKEARIADIMEVKETRISINRFERIVKRSDFKILKRQFYFINPSYKHKFGIKPRKQAGVIAAIPILRDFVTTTCYYVLKKG